MPDHAWEQDEAAIPEDLPADPVASHDPARARLFETQESADADRTPRAVPAPRVEAIHTTDTTPSTDPPPYYVSWRTRVTHSWGYRLIRKIAQGGVGEVWEAWQESLGRHVAIKRLRQQPAAGRTAVPDAVGSGEVFFRQEALTTASLDHPNIVPVYDLGIGEDGQPMLAMKLVHGQPWDKLLESTLNGSDQWDYLRSHLPILIDVAQAVNFAHSRGILHRDIKPSQVMVGDYGEVLLMDWGLAIVYDSGKAERHGLTVQESGLGATRESASSPSGTVAFMAPEQTRPTAADLGPWTDVYLLGATLYFILTGTPPHNAKDSRGAFEQARSGHVQPPDMRAPNRMIPKDLADLCRDAMTADPAARIPTADVFIHRLQDCLTGASKQREALRLVAKVRDRLEVPSPDYKDFAGCVNLLTRAETLWSEHPDIRTLRHQVLAGYAESALANKDLVLARMEAERLEPSDDRVRLLDEIDSRERQQKRIRVQRSILMAATFLLLVLVSYLAALASRDARAARSAQRQAESAMSEAVRERARADDRAAAALYVHYLSNIRFAQFCLAQGRLDAARQYLLDTPAELRHWEWGHLMGQSHLRLLTLEGHKATLHGCEFSPDGSMALTASGDKTARVWDTSSGRELAVLAGHLGLLESARFSPGGTQIATASNDGTIKLWSAPDWRETRTLEGHTRGVIDARFLADGTQLLSCAHDGGVRLWDLRTSGSLVLVSGREGDLHGAAPDPAGARFVTAGEDKTARIVDIKTGAELTVMRGHLGRVLSAEFSPSGALVATGSEDKTIRLWSAGTGQERAVLRGHRGAVATVEFGPREQRLVSASADGSAAIWDIFTGRQLVTLGDRATQIESATFVPQGARVLTASLDGTAALWSSGPEGEFATLELASRSPEDAEYSADGSLYVVRMHGGPAEVWRSEEARSHGTIPEAEGTANLAALSPDGRWIAAARERAMAVLLDAQTLKEGGTFVVVYPEDARVESLAFAADRTHLIAGLADGTGVVWSMDTTREEGRLAGMKGRGPLRLVGAHPLNVIAGHTGSDMAIVWSAMDGAEQYRITLPGERLSQVAFSPNATALAVATDSGMVAAYSASDGRELAKFRQPGGETAWIVFSPDEQHLLTAGGDGVARLWNIHSGQEVHAFSGHAGGIAHAAFSPDGARLVTGSRDQTARLWDAVTGRELLTLEGQHGEILHADFRPDSHQIATLSSDGTAKLWNAVPWVESELPGDPALGWESRLELWHRQNAALASSEEDVAAARKAEGGSAVSVAETYRQCLPDILGGAEGPLTLEQQASIAEGTPVRVLGLLPQLHEGKTLFLVGDKAQLGTWVPNTVAMRYVRESPCGHVWEVELTWEKMLFKFTYGRPGDGWEHTQEWPGDPNRELPSDKAALFRTPEGGLVLVGEFSIRPGG
ncbi:protein kinase [Candidatus Poribacteria bacterium]|nr:protein kinase [Candidatus Poribacteria bacterium]